MALLTLKALGCAESAYLNGMWEHDEGTGKMAFFSIYVDEVIC